MFDRMSKQLNPTDTPATQPIPGKAMVQMRSGGYGFGADQLEQLYALLILGNESGSFYESADDMQDRSAELLRTIVKSNPCGLIEVIEEVSRKGLAIKNTYPVFALAVVAVMAEGVDIRRAAFDLLPHIARNGSDFLAFASFYIKLGGNWGRLAKRGFTSWYNFQSIDDIAYQMVKYQARSGVSHGDVWRLAHILSQTGSGVMTTLSNWLKNGLVEEAAGYDELRLLIGHAAVNKAETEAEVVQLIGEYGLTREMIPTRWLNSERVWSALLVKMPYWALIRNLNKMTAVGVFNSANRRGQVVQKIRNAEAISKSRVHPINILLAQKQYAKGKGDKGSLTWEPVPAIIDALDEAFYLALQHQEIIEKNVLVVIDTSISTRSLTVAGKNITTRHASGAMALAAMHRYANVDVLCVDTQLHFPAISKRQRLDDVARQIERIRGSGTYLSLVWEHLISTGKQYDGVLYFTDNESWMGGHSSEGWRDYRKATGNKARLLYVRMALNEYTLVDPSDTSARQGTGFSAALFDQFDLMLNGIL